MIRFQHIRIGVRRLTRKLTGPFARVLERVAALNGFFAGVHYAIVSSAFRREQLAVLRGRIQYRRTTSHPQGTSYLLRRNIHRIEKGLIMRPRRPVFAKDYISATVKAYVAASSTAGSVDAAELEWARGVLSAYFGVVKEDPRINSLKQLFCDANAGRDGCGPMPYPASELARRPVTAEQFSELCEIRRSVRWYDGRPVPRDAVDRAIRAAATAPSACNRQAFHYRIYDEPELVKRVASVPMGTTGFSDNFPAVAVLVGDLSAYFDERDRHLIYIDGSLSAMTFMFALQTEGISSCGINWPDIPDREALIRTTIGLRRHERVVMFISFGYAMPEGLVPSSVKKPVDIMRSYNVTAAPRTGRR
ncbi:MAG: nitroreductase family protein [Thermomicrobiales bacterium]|nr:nitroreductase family protein [Thermomicrobiales bacterium]